MTAVQVQEQGQVVNFITFYTTSNVFELFLNSFKSSKRTHFKEKLDAKLGASFELNVLLNAVSYVCALGANNIILNLEDRIIFIAIWPGIAPYLRIDCAAELIKCTIFNFPS
jgi:hypothetical protein